jgi:hypothetical protein
VLYVWYTYSQPARKSTRNRRGSGTVSRWVIGWGIGALVVVVAASLLVTIIALCRRIVGEAEDITAALDSARERTDVLFALTRTNGAVAGITKDLAAVREGLEST